MDQLFVQFLQPPGFLAVLNEHDIIVELGQSIFVLDDLFCIVVEFKKRDILLPAVRFSELFLPELFQFFFIIRYFLFCADSKFIQARVVDLLEDEPQVQLCIRQRTQFFSVHFIERVDDLVMNSKNERRIRTARFGRIVDDNDARQVGKPFKIVKHVPAHALRLDDKDAGHIVLNLTEERIGIGKLDDPHILYVEHLRRKEFDNGIRAAAHDRPDESVQPFEIHGQFYPGKKISFFRVGRIMCALNDHLFKHIHKVIPLGFFDIAAETDNIPELAQFSRIVPEN